MISNDKIWQFLLGVSFITQSHQTFLHFGNLSEVFGQTSKYWFIYLEKHLFEILNKNLQKNVIKSIEHENNKANQFWKYFLINSIFVHHMEI